MSPTRAEMSSEMARATVAPFYKALNAEFAGQSPDLIKRAMAGGWVSCRSNDVSRDEVFTGIGQRLKSVPDLKRQIKEVLVAGNQFTFRGEATGTPRGRVHGCAAGRQVVQGDVDQHSHHRRR